MLDKYFLEFIYAKKGSNKQYSTSELITDDYEIAVTATADSLTMAITPKQKIILIDVILHFDREFTDSEKVFANGYQSWTTSREYGKKDKQKGLRCLSQYKPFRKFFAACGDYDFIYYPVSLGMAHSFTYSYIRDGQDVEFVGSLDERSGYTIVGFSMNEGRMFIRKDIESIEVSETYNLFNLVHLNGSYDEVFDKYFEVMNIAPLKLKHLSGYTSWYNYYGKICEAQLLRDLDGLATIGDGASIFQIDDGYQSIVGDWLTLKNDKFPNGMRVISDAIHSKGYLAGIWVAPFAAARNSRVAIEHPEWLIRDSNGRKQIGAVAWGGAYTLDIYNKDAAAYIKKCLETILNDWNYDLVKLDFLYAQCIQPRDNKSRGQIMCDAMDFLRECVQDKLILGCGVPLGPSFGKVDLCRISCDVAKTYRDARYAFTCNQEIPSTRNVLNNTIFRRHLNGRVFVNDPDVFYLRANDNYKTDEHCSKFGWLLFTDEQKKLLATINNMFGDVLFVSDNIGGYDGVRIEQIKEFFSPSTKKCIVAEYVSKSNIAITYEQDNQQHRLVFNIDTGTLV